MGFRMKIVNTAMKEYFLDQKPLLRTFLEINKT